MECIPRAKWDGREAELYAQAWTLGIEANELNTLVASSVSSASLPQSANIPRCRREPRGKPYLRRAHYFSSPARAARLHGTSLSDEGFQHGDVVIIAFALDVAMVKSQLLGHRQAVHHSSVDQSLGEGVLGIPERLPTFDIGLPTDAPGVEGDCVNIDLASAVRNKCNATRSPVRLHPVTMPAESLQQVIERHLCDIDGEIEIAVDPGLTPNQCVDTPPAGNPDAVKPCPVSDTEHSHNIGTGHVPPSVVTDGRHHEASQAGAKRSGTGSDVAFAHGSTGGTVRSACEVARPGQ
jgi:hypothetical protein